MNYFKTIIAVAALSFSTAAVAQNTESAYFADGHLYRHDMNPAIGNDKGYVAFPALGNFNIGMGGNIGVENVLFNRNGKTVTFLHPDVSKSEFLKGIHDKNKITEDLKLQILGFGFKGFGGYNTFEVNVRENLGVMLPGSVFELAKEGLTNRVYDITNLGAHADAYAELALGHSHQINDHLRIGAKVKVLVGGANVDVKLNNAYAELGADGNYTATVDGEAHVNMKGFTFKEKTEMRDQYDNNGQKLPQQKAVKVIDDVDVDGAGIGGIGFGVDLGAVYKLDDSWKFSAAILDLGFINWTNDVVARANGTHSINTNDYAYDIENDIFANESGRKFDDALEEFKDLYDLKSEGDKGGCSKMLASTLNLGVEYTAPFYNKLSFGLLNTTRINGDYSWTDFRLSANIAPAKLFSASASVSAGTYGVGFGWIIDFHPSGFGLFVAMDHTPTKLAKQGVPLNSNLQLSMGINIPF